MTLFHIYQEIRTVHLTGTTIAFIILFIEVGVGFILNTPWSPGAVDYWTIIVVNDGRILRKMAASWFYPSCCITNQCHSATTGPTTRTVVSISCVAVRPFNIGGNIPMG